MGIANRGEVAVRIIRACQELGVKAVLLHSEADEQTIAYRLADEVICIGGSPIANSYMNMQAVIDGALAGGCDAIHPGFGFLSENAEFAAKCIEHKLIFIGPTPESIALFGDKISAKKLVETTECPVIPGYKGEDQSVERLLKEMDSIGYPVMVKVAGGGGGRGLKVAHTKDEAEAAIESAKREGLNAFGSDQLFLEKYLDDAKHIEVQIFGDCTGKVYHLYERECSIQRRHQKVIEESLGEIPLEMREQIHKSAVSVAEKAKYLGAGTVEFLVQDGKFYFLEMNTRLQVEHPVSEMLMGVDLVKAQIMVADDQSVIWDQKDLVPHGHAIECRIYAEDPYLGGVPSVGRLGFCRWPYGPGRRFEVGFDEGDTITTNYDSMIAKIIVRDETRTRAISKMKQTLKETIIFGLKTNIPFLLEILNHQEFVEGTMSTQFLNKHFPGAIEKKELSKKEDLIIEAMLKQVSGVKNKSVTKNPWFEA